MIYCYNFFIRLYSVAAFLFGLFNTKANQWVNGRKKLLSKIQKAFENNTDKVVWMHCASLGEFEQGRPIIEKLKNENPNNKILITFFSPSGYEIQKNYQYADWVFYLPIDTAKNVESFYNIVQPSLIIFVKYEFWYFYIKEAAKRKIPLLLVSGVFRQNQPFFKWYGKLHLEMLNYFTNFFIQGQLSFDNLTSIHQQNNITICGDTRFDRVIEIANSSYQNNIIEEFIGNNLVVIVGSSWRDDDLVLDHYANTHPKIKFIIAPHEVHEERLQECLEYFKNSILYSTLSKTKSNSNILIIDNVGMLSKLYRYASICFVGGGFGGDGVHNVVEAAVYSKPVIFGPIFDKFREATELESIGGAITVENALELEACLDELLSNENKRHSIGQIAGNYVKANAGATETIIEYIYANRLLTK